MASPPTTAASIACSGSARRGSTATTITCSKRAPDTGRSKAPRSLPQRSPGGLYEPHAVVLDRGGDRALDERAASRKRRTGRRAGADGRTGRAGFAGIDSRPCAAREHRLSARRRRRRPRPRPKGPPAPDDPTVEHISPGLDEERKRFGKYHGLDPWDDPALFVSEPGTGLVYDVRELPQTRPGYVQSPVTGKEFAIAPNVVAQAGKGGALREPAFDKEGKAQDVDSDATGTK